MPFHISADIRSAAINYWLKGESRDEIASKLNISAGAVTNIINEWRINLGSLIVDDLRELSLSLKRAGLSPSECAIGFRVAKMMQRFGITEEQFEYFMKETYNKCQLLDIGPIQIGKYLTEIVNLSNTIFPSQIPNYINIKKRESETLNEQIKNMQKMVSELNDKKLKEEEDLKLLIENNKISKEAINWYKDIIKEIKNNGIPIDNAKFFIQCLKSIKNEGYDVNKVIMKYSESVYLNESIRIQEDTKQQILRDITNLENHKKFLEDEINRDRLKAHKLTELDNIGFGYKELTMVYNTIIEIARDNNMDFIEAIKRFFNEFNEYDNIINSKKRVEELKNEFSNLNIQITNSRKIISSQQHIGMILQGLLRIGISENDIEDIYSILSLGKFDYYDDINSNNAIINKQSLISELKEYRDIKLVNKSLRQKQIQLTNKMKELENQKKELQNYINTFLSMFYNLVDLYTILNKINILKEHNKKIMLNVFLLFSYFKDDKGNAIDYNESHKEKKNDDSKDTNKGNE